jgi:MFS family permease
MSWGRTRFHLPREKSVMLKELPRRRNYWIVQWELLPAAILGAIAGFNGAFAVRLGATDDQMALLSSLPALLSALLYVPLARFLEGREKPIRWMWGSLLLLRLGYLVIPLIPLLFAQNAGPWLVAWLITLTLPSVLFNAGWTPLLLELVRSRDRARIFANRNVISSLVVAIVAFVAGRWLDANADAFPNNYQILYVIGVFCAILSSIMLLRLIIPKNFLKKAHKPATIPDVSLQGSSVGRALAGFRRTFSELREDQGFFNMTLNTLILNLGIWAVGPLWIIYYVRELGAPDSWIGLNSALTNAALIIGYKIWQRIIDHKGKDWVMPRTLPFIMFFPIMVAFFPNLAVILIIGIIHNMITSGYGLSHSNTLYDVCPVEKRTRYLSFYNALMNAGAFISPMIGVAISGFLSGLTDPMTGIRLTLLLAAGVRGLGIILFYVNKVTVPEQSGDPSEDTEE